MNQPFNYQSRIDSEFFSNLTHEELEKFVKLKTASFELQTKVSLLENAANQILSDCLDRLIADVDKQLAEKENKKKPKPRTKRK